MFWASFNDVVSNVGAILLFVVSLLIVVEMVWGREGYLGRLFRWLVVLLVALSMLHLAWWLALGLVALYLGERFFRDRRGGA